MASQENSIMELFELWNTGKSSQEQDVKLRQLLQSKLEADKLTPVLERIWNELQPSSLFSISETDAMVNKILIQSPVEPKVTENISAVHPIRLKSWLKYAAAIIFLVGLAVYIRTERQVKINKPVAATKTHSGGTIVPGVNKAILKLADGTMVDLENANIGILGGDSSNRIVKLKPGQLSYQLQDYQAQNMGENTISTPRGGFYMVELSDGTKVWLNASSSISYQVIFKGNERRVRLTGEAYFEVAKNASMPFKVSVNNMEVTVMGTHFNVKAYDEESSIKTTLLEGSVRVSSGSLSTMLRPGQKAEWQRNQSPFVAQNADTEEAVAWKNGFFIFNSTPLSSIMLQLSRWYDFDYKISEDIGSNKFSGTIARTTSISKILEMLALTKEASFNIEGKTVFVDK